MCDDVSIQGIVALLSLEVCGTEDRKMIDRDVTGQCVCNLFNLTRCVDNLAVVLHLAWHPLMCLESLRIYVRGP